VKKLKKEERDVEEQRELSIMCGIEREKKILYVTCGIDYRERKKNLM
jgi:hypothetical protein